MSDVYHPRVRSLLYSARRPSAREVDAYAQIIAEVEGRCFDECREQAELQLWASRPSRPRKVRIGTSAENLSPAV